MHEIGGESSPTRTVRKVTIPNLCVQRIGMRPTQRVQTITPMFIDSLRIVLIQARKETGGSQVEVARAAGIESSNFSNFENGKAGWPRDTDRYVDAYAKVAGRRPEELWAEALALQLRRTRRRRLTLGADGQQTLRRLLDTP